MSPAPSFLKRDLSLGMPKLPKLTSLPKPSKPSLPSKPQRKSKPPTAAHSGGRRKQVVGLKIGSSQVAAAVVANNGGPHLVTAVRDQLPAGLVAGGELQDPDGLAQALDSFFRTHGLPRKNVRLGIGNNRIGVRVFDRPPVDDPRQLANAIRFRAHETLPIPIEEAMLDYHIIDDGDGAGRVLLAVAYRDLVERFGGACAAANVDLFGVDLEAFALLRAASAPLDGGDRPEAARVAVAIGHDRTTVAVSDGRVCEFTRVLDWGGANVTAAIERSVGVDAAEAERLKRSLELRNGSHGGADTNDGRAVEAARREVQNLARELASSLAFYQAQPGSLGFADIAVTGGSSHLRGLSDQLEELIGISVRVADPFARVGTGDRVVDGGQAGSLAVAIGLGIED